MAAAMLVALVAGYDLILWRLTGVALAVAAGVWGAVLVLAPVAFGAVTPWWGAAAALAAAVWIALRRALGADVAALTLVASAALLAVAADGGPGAAVLGGAGAAVFLAHGANDVCRAVIARARVSDAAAADNAAENAEDGPTDPPERSRAGLRGGRFIGPLERWIIAALAVVGAQAVIVGVMAAKGIGRFPEISGDRGRGSAAEEFLVGSLVSWALAGAAAALVVAVGA